MACQQTLRDYITIWNLVDWMSIIIAFTLLGMWIVTCMDRAELQARVTHGLSHLMVREDHISTLLTACDAGDAEQCNSLQGPWEGIARRSATSGWDPLRKMNLPFEGAVAGGRVKG